MILNIPEIQTFANELLIFALPLASCSDKKKLTFGAHPLAICEAWQSIPSRGPAEDAVGSS